LDRIGAWGNFAAFDGLEGARTGFTEFGQLPLRLFFLPAQFRNFEVEIRLVHGLLLD
jgi:hypothetical protein